MAATVAAPSFSITPSPQTLPGRRSQGRSPVLPAAPCMAVPQGGSQAGAERAGVRVLPPHITFLAEGAWVSPTDTIPCLGEHETTMGGREPGGPSSSRMPEPARRLLSGLCPGVGRTRDSAVVPTALYLLSTHTPGLQRGVQPLALPLLSWLGTSTVYAERRKDRFRQAARHG